MIPLEYKNFIVLDDEMRELWLVGFLAGHNSPSWECDGYDACYPAFRHGEDEVDFIANSVNMSASNPSWRSSIKKTLDHILASEANLCGEADRPLVLARTITIMARCGLANTVFKIVDLLNRNAYDNYMVTIGGRCTSFQAAAWNAVITFGEYGGLRGLLIRDIAKADCGALCFRALGCIDLGEMIRHVPTVLLMHGRNSCNIIAETMRESVPSVLLTGDFGDAWNIALNTIYKSYMLNYLLEPIGFGDIDEKPPIGSTLWRGLALAGIELSLARNVVTLRSDSAPSAVEVLLVNEGEPSVHESAMGRDVELFSDADEVEADAILKNLVA